MNKDSRESSDIKFGGNRNREHRFEIVGTGNMTADRQQDIKRNDHSMTHTH